MPAAQINHAEHQLCKSIAQHYVVVTANKSPCCLCLLLTEDC